MKSKTTGQMASQASSTEGRESAVKGSWLRYYPHALGIILETGFEEFAAACGVHGLAKEHGYTIEILAVNADQPGSGQFRAFIEGLKESFGEILIWEVWNPDLRLMLGRYGFRRTRRTDHYKDGGSETLSGFKWERHDVREAP